MTAELPVVGPPEKVDRETDAEPRVAGILLAAGTSSRFGDGNKLLADLKGVPLVRHAARTLVAADVSPLVAVVGADGDRVAAALDGLGFTIINNPAFEDGQATSVRAGVQAVRERTGIDVIPEQSDIEAGRKPTDIDAALFALGDMPCIFPDAVDALVRTYRAGGWSGLAAAYEGERGNPVLFDRQHFDDLASVEGDVGGRQILQGGKNTALVETGDPGVRVDVDTREGLADVRRKWAD